MSLPPIEFLFEASTQTLQDFELAALNHAANLSKAIRSELDMYVEKTAEALLTRWIKENRSALLREAAKRIELKPKKTELFASEEDRKSA